MSGAAAAPFDITGLRFLVVEDHGFQRWAIGHILERMGAAEVFSASDGYAALELLRTVVPKVDVVITDLDMPGMDGMQFIRHLGQSAMPVSLVLASGLDPALVVSVESMARAYDVALLGTAPKPVTAITLAEVLKRYRPDASGSPRPKAPGFESGDVSAAIDRGEIGPYFQPKVDLRDGQLRGAEALARWFHPSLGIIGPDDFIRILETSGAIGGLTLKMLADAAALCRQWRSEGIDVPVSVNVSLNSLIDVELADRLEIVVMRAGITPRNVILEITETAAASHLGKVLENLARLRMKGFGLAIDDFGTGYASMEQLTRIPFTELKIDQSFVRGAAASRSSRAVLESSLDMAAKLGICAVAEGIERLEEIILLRELHCHLGQGYVIARPMPPQEFMAWIRGKDRRPWNASG
jgi:EAL domain-containing protein (putative c-di-GMP-specific phosphodiesterase class I)/CheY-like chemotaxis protein